MGGPSRHVGGRPSCPPRGRPGASTPGRVQPAGGLYGMCPLPIPPPQPCSWAHCGLWASWLDSPRINCVQAAAIGSRSEANHRPCTRRVLLLFVAVVVWLLARAGDDGDDVVVCHGPPHPCDGAHAMVCCPHLRWGSLWPASPKSYGAWGRLRDRPAPRTSPSTGSFRQRASRPAGKLRGGQPLASCATGTCPVPCAIM